MSGMRAHQARDTRGHVARHVPSVDCRQRPERGGRPCVWLGGRASFVIGTLVSLVRLLGVCCLARLNASLRLITLVHVVSLRTLLASTARCSRNGLKHVVLIGRARSLLCLLLRNRYARLSSRTIESDAMVFVGQRPLIDACLLCSAAIAFHLRCVTPRDFPRSASI